MFILFLFSTCDKIKKISVNEKVYPTDYKCQSELAQAKKDTKDGQLVYCHYLTNESLLSFRSEDEFKHILKQNNIGYKFDFFTCMVIDGQTNHCYCEYVNNNFFKKKSKKFIDSLLNKADSLFLISHKNDSLDHPLRDVHRSLDKRD